MEKIRKINGIDYIENVSCFKIKNKWRSIEDEEVAYDHYNKCYSLKALLTHGCIDNNGNLGYFTKNYKSIETDNGWFMDCTDVVGFVKPNEFRFVSTKPLQHKTGIVHPYALAYSYSDKDKYNYIKQIEQSYENSPIDISKEAIKLAKYFTKGYTFGLEYETCDGTIPTSYLGVLGLVPLKDGSLRLKSGEEPYEYASVPMQGAKGLQSIADQCWFLDTYCHHDWDTSLHLHIGNINTNKINIVALYKLCVILQSELFSLVPVFKKDPQYYLGPNLKNGDTRKNYARFLPALSGSDVSRAIDDMFFIFSDGCELGISYQRGMNHIKKDKWHHNNRYFCINFEHLLLGDSGTVEFRLKDTSFKGSTVIAWLLICIAIVNYAEIHANQLVHNKVHPDLSEVVRGLLNNFGTLPDSSLKQPYVYTLLETISNAKRMYLHCLGTSNTRTSVFECRSLLVPTNFFNGSKKQFILNTPSEKTIPFSRYQEILEKAKINLQQVDPFIIEDMAAPPGVEIVEEEKIENGEDIFWFKMDEKIIEQKQKELKDKLLEQVEA